MANPPVAKIRIPGGIEVAVWEGTRVVREENIKVFSVKVSRTYKDKDGNWQDTQFIDMRDVPALALALQRAYAQFGMKAPDAAKGSDKAAAPAPAPANPDDVPF